MFREGFEVVAENLPAAIDTTQLPLELKRPITISNLFLNHRLPIRDIMRILNETYRNVVVALIARNVVRDRRGRMPRVFHGMERRSKQH